MNYDICMFVRLFLLACAAGHPQGQTETSARQLWHIEYHRDIFEVFGWIVRMPGVKTLEFYKKQDNFLTQIILL